ncbi:MAG: Ldh family oxidoreductase [Parvibaculaceae bacterium]
MSGPVVAEDALFDLCMAVLSAGGVTADQAQEVSRNLVWSEMVGRENFGLKRLPVYLERLAAGGLKPDAAPSFTELTPSAGLIDGDAGFGQYAGRLAADRAVDLARSSGVGTVGVRNSNFFGTGAYFVHRIAEAGMIGLAMSNSFPKVVAHGGLTPVFGTNPFAFGAPRRDGRSLMFDMATSALAGSAVREHMDKGQSLPEGMAIDEEGVPVTDPAKVAEGALLPVAGAKGYGLSLMVEILAGVLTGAGVADGVASMYKQVSAPGQNGHFLVALDISRFMPLETFYDRLEGLVGMIKASHPDNEILLPGEVRWKTYEESRASGIRLDEGTRGTVEAICERMGLPVPWSGMCVAGR